LKLRPASEQQDRAPAAGRNANCRRRNNGQIAPQPSGWTAGYAGIERHWQRPPDLHRVRIVVRH
jgi:hypothetical protein